MELAYFLNNIKQQKKFNNKIFCNKKRMAK